MSSTSRPSTLFPKKVLRRDWSYCRKLRRCLSRFKRVKTSMTSLFSCSHCTIWHFVTRNWACWTSVHRACSSAWPTWTATMCKNTSMTLQILLLSLKCSSTSARRTCRYVLYFLRFINTRRRPCMRTKQSWLLTSSFTTQRIFAPTSQKNSYKKSR